MMRKIIFCLVGIVGAIALWLVCFSDNEQGNSDDKGVKQADSSIDKADSVKDNGKISNDSSLKVYSFENQDGENVEIKAEKKVSAIGFAGASNHVFYLKNSKLHYMNLGTGLDEIIAENVSDIYLNGDEVTAVLGKDGEILKENTYITYK